MIHREQQASQSTPSPEIDLAAETCMFESAYSSAADHTPTNEPIGGVVGT